MYCVAVMALLGLTGDAPRPIEVKIPSRTTPASFAKNVAEILDAKCAGCHGSAVAENKLNLETVAGMLKGGKRGAASYPERPTRASSSRWPRTASRPRCRQRRRRTCRR